MIRKIQLNDTGQSLELLMLQQLSYRIEAQLIGFKEIPPLWDSPMTLRECGEVFFGYYEEGHLSGAMSIKQTVRELTICRLMVHPSCFRRGIASRLLKSAEELALPGIWIKVSTGTQNEPAMKLYLKYGYEPSQTMEISQGITLTVFRKLVV